MIAQAEKIGGARRLIVPVVRQNRGATGFGMSKDAVHLIRECPPFKSEHAKEFSKRLVGRIGFHFNYSAKSVLANSIERNRSIE